MSREESPENGFEWNDEERSALASLATVPLGGARGDVTAVAPPRALEERTVERLRREGLIHDAAVPFWTRLLGGRRSGGAGSPRFAWAAAAAACAVALFFAGVAVGQRSAVRTTAEALAAYHGDALVAASARVQQTGSAYVAALAALALTATDDADPEQLAQGREVALAALYAAAEELVRFDPYDPVAARLVHDLEAVDRDDEGDGEERKRQVMWF